MSITFGDLKTDLAVELNDPDNKTFSATKIGWLVNRGVAEVGRIAPEMFQEDIVPVADQLAYTLRSTAFNGVPNPQIEVARVELWDGTTTPPTFKATIPSGARQPEAYHDAGWSNWGGVLTIPRRIVVYIEGNEANWYYRVWGYSPYADLSADSDVANLSTEGVFATIAFAKVEALDELLTDRNLFTQWQTRSGNTDISPAGLMNELNFARANWRSYSRNLTRLRAAI